MGKSLFPIVAEWKCDNLENDFVVRAKYIQVKQLSCKEHGIQYGKRDTCWKCGTADLIKQDKKLICFYVNLKEYKTSVSDVLDKTTQNWKWDSTKVFGRVVAVSLKTFSTDLTALLNSLKAVEGFKVINQITEAELEEAWKKEQNNKLLRQL